MKSRCRKVRQKNVGLYQRSTEDELSANLASTRYITQGEVTKANLTANLMVVLYEPLKLIKDENKRV